MTGITIMLITITLLLCIIMILLWWQYDEHGRAFHKLNSLLMENGVNSLQMIEVLREIKEDTSRIRGIERESQRDDLYDPVLGRTQDD